MGVAAQGQGHGDGFLHSSNGPVFAPGLENRVQNQGARTLDGIRRGSLSKEEMGQVGESRKQFGASLTEAKGDGSVSREERVALHQQLNDMSQMLFDLEHNREASHGSRCRQGLPSNDGGPDPLRTRALGKATHTTRAAVSCGPCT